MLKRRCLYVPTTERGDRHQAPSCASGIESTWKRCSVPPAVCYTMLGKNAVVPPPSFRSGRGSWTTAPIVRAFTCVILVSQGEDRRWSGLSTPGCPASRKGVMDARRTTPRSTGENQIQAPSSPEWGAARSPGSEIHTPRSPDSPRLGQGRSTASRNSTRAP
jgi:hypothetical protein